MYDLSHKNIAETAFALR